MLNNTVATWIQIVLAFALGVGAAVAATYNTFEPQTTHNRDINRIEEQRQNDRDELFDRLQRMEDKIDRLAGPKAKVPEQPPVFDGYGRPPRLQRQA